MWNFDISQAPKGKTKKITRTLKGKEVETELHVPEKILAAGNEGVVTLSHWIEKEQRWNMFTKDVPPLAWMPWPKHPYGEDT